MSNMFCLLWEFSRDKVSISQWTWNKLTNNNLKLPMFISPFLLLEDETCFSFLIPYIFTNIYFRDIKVCFVLCCCCCLYNKFGHAVCSVQPFHVFESVLSMEPTKFWVELDFHPVGEWSWWMVGWTWTLHINFQL